MTNILAPAILFIETGLQSKSFDFDCLKKLLRIKWRGYSKISSWGPKVLGLVIFYSLLFACVKKRATVVASIAKEQKAASGIVGVT